MSAKRLLILVVAYNASRTIKSVLARVPVAELPADTEVLVIEDSSQDETFKMPQESIDSLRGLKLNVLFNTAGQGYGGNLKLGFYYAIKKGFDVVALLHGDGQYAPEELPALVKPVLAGEADACFGSRMMEKGDALKHGMPLYKFAGNRILSAFQNRMTGLKLTEFHSGYRVYSVSALRQLPFRYNTNDFYFDTEIVIQFALRGLRIKELPIPSYYGNEIRFLNGLAYGWHVIKTTLASRIHGTGLFYRRRYDVAGEEFEYGIKLGYQSSHTMAIAAVKPGSSVLDLGCGRGLVAAELCAKGCWVTGLDKTMVPDSRLMKFVSHDLNSPSLPESLETYDYILALDCLEHLESSERFLQELRSRCYADKTTVILTTPNIGFFITRFGLLFGQFNYARQGILDMTHRRLFTFRTFRRLIEQEGYTITRTEGIAAPFIKALGERWLSRFLLNLNRLLIQLWPAMFAYQIYVEAKFQPPLDGLLARAVRVSSPPTHKGNPTSR